MSTVEYDRGGYAKHMQQNKLRCVNFYWSTNHVPYALNKVNVATLMPAGHLTVALVHQPKIPSTSVETTASPTRHIGKRNARTAPVA